MILTSSFYLMERYWSSVLISGVSRFITASWVYNLNIKTKTYKLKSNVLVVNVLCELTFQTQIREKYFWQLSYIITKLSLILKRAKFSFHIYVCISTLFKQRLISINSASPSLCDSVCMYVRKRKWTNVKTKETFTAREK